MTSQRSTRAWLFERLFEPIDGASLAAFRVIFGLILAWEAVRFLSSGWIERYFNAPGFHFWYPGFRWVEPWPEPWMNVHFVALGLLGTCMALGAGYRVVSAGYALGFTWVFLLDPTTYLNHLYLVCLLCGLMVVVPAHRVWSVDAWAAPSFRRERVSAWGLYALRGLVALVYFHAGLAKLNPDWLRAQPLLIWMESRSDFAVIGPLLAWDPTAWAMSYGGLLLDLLAGPMLLYRHTRPFMLCLLAAFHLSNVVLFDIGIFPWLMLAANLLFLDPGWPRRMLGLAAPAADAPAAAPGPFRRKAVAVGLALFFWVQALVPLRHVLYPGRPSWTEEGHRFSWHMKLRTKRGTTRFRVVDRKTGATIPYALDHLGDRQLRKFGTDPELIRQLAWHLRERAAADGLDVAVYADAQVGLNGRPLQGLVDPTVDLSRVEWSWRPAEWILPLAEPLPGWE